MSDKKCHICNGMTDGLFLIKSPWSDDEAHYRNPYHFIDEVVSYAEDGMCPIMRDGGPVVDSLTFAQGQSDIKGSMTCQFVPIVIPDGETRPIPAKEDGDVFDEGIAIIVTLYTPEVLTFSEMATKGAGAILTHVNLGNEDLADDLYGETQCSYVKIAQCVNPELDAIKCDAWSCYVMGAR